MAYVRAEKKELDYDEKRYCYNLLSDIDDLAYDETFTDVKIYAKDCYFNAHKVILAAASPYFKAMFTSGMKESDDGEVDLSFIEDDIMSDILHYMHTGWISINESVVQALYEVSDFLQLENLTAVCRDYMLTHIEPSNCLVSYAFAKVHSIKLLQDLAEQFLYVHFALVIEETTEEDVENLSEGDLVKFLSTDKVRSSKHSEHDVCMLLAKWVKADFEERETKFDDLLEHVRFELCCSEFLQGILRCGIELSDIRQGQIQGAIQKTQIQHEESTQNESQDSNHSQSQELTKSQESQKSTQNQSQESAPKAEQNESQDSNQNQPQELTQSESQESTQNQHQESASKAEQPKENFKQTQHSGLVVLGGSLSNGKMNQSYYILSKDNEWEERSLGHEVKTACKFKEGQIIALTGNDKLLLINVKHANETTKELPVPEHDKKKRLLGSDDGVYLLTFENLYKLCHERLEWEKICEPRMTKASDFLYADKVKWRDDLDALPMVICGKHLYIITDIPSFAEGRKEVMMSRDDDRKRYNDGCIWLLDTETGTWYEREGNSRLHAGINMFTMGSHLYMFDHYYLLSDKCIEHFDIFRNTCSANEKERVHPLPPSIRENNTACMTVWEDKLLLSGGLMEPDGTRDSLWFLNDQSFECSSLIEEYDPVEKKWSRWHANLPVPLQKHCVLAMEL